MEANTSHVFETYKCELKIIPMKLFTSPKHYKIILKTLYPSPSLLFPPPPRHPSPSPTSHLTHSPSHLITH